NATGTPGVSPMTSVVDWTSVGLGQAEDVNALVVTNDVVKRVVSTTSQTIEYEIVVTNTFDHPISDIVVKDDLSIGVACTGMALLNTQQLHLDGLDAHESGRIHVTETISQTGSLSNKVIFLSAVDDFTGSTITTLSAHGTGEWTVGCTPFAPTLINEIVVEP